MLSAGRLVFKRVKSSTDVHIPTKSRIITFPSEGPRDEWVHRHGKLKRSAVVKKKRSDLLESSSLGFEHNSNWKPILRT